MDDISLLTKILNRDTKAIYRFYQTYQPKLTRYIRAKVANPHDADELVQDTLFAFLESLRDFEGKAKISTFLFAICQHKIIDYYRKKRLTQIVFSRLPQVQALISPLLGPEERYDQVMVKEKFHSALKALIPQYQKVLQYRYLHGLSIKEIAGRLTTSIKSVECQLFRARKAFACEYNGI